MSVAPPWAHTGETVIQEYTAPKIIEKWNTPSQIFLTSEFLIWAFFRALHELPPSKNIFFVHFPDTFGSNKRLYYAIIAYS